MRFGDQPSEPNNSLQVPDGSSEERSPSPRTCQEALQNKRRYIKLYYHNWIFALFINFKVIFRIIYQLTLLLTYHYSSSKIKEVRTA